jgi:hypothetical protein
MDRKGTHSTVPYLLSLRPVLRFRYSMKDVFPGFCFSASTRRGRPCTTREPHHEKDDKNDDDLDEAEEFPRFFL